MLRGRIKAAYKEIKPILSYLSAGNTLDKPEAVFPLTQDPDPWSLSRLEFGAWCLMLPAQRVSPYA